MLPRTLAPNSVFILRFFLLGHLVKYVPTVVCYGSWIIYVQYVLKRHISFTERSGCCLKLHPRTENPHRNQISVHPKIEIVKTITFENWEVCGTWLRSHRTNKQKRWRWKLGWRWTQQMPIKSKRVSDRGELLVINKKGMPQLAHPDPELALTAIAH